MMTVSTAFGWCGDEQIVNLPQFPALGMWLNGSCLNEKILIRGGYSGKREKNIQGINEHAIKPILGG